MRTSWIFVTLLALFNLLISIYELRKKDIWNINTFFSKVTYKFITTITVFFPLQKDNLRGFINTHFGKLIEHFVIIAICRYLSDSKPNWFNNNSYCIVIVLYSIGLTVLILTPGLRRRVSKSSSELPRELSLSQCKK